LVTLVAALAFTASGCAVVRFLAGAPPARTAGRSSALLARRCTGCHEVPDPASMSGAAWQAALERMQQRIVLPSSEWDSLAAMAPVDVRR
jgi:hypothetical protein